MRFFLLIFFSFISVSSFSQSYSDSISVNYFLLDECVITIHMTSEMNAIYHEFKSDTFQFYGYFPNMASKPAAIEKFVSKYRLDFQVKTDYFKKKSKKYKATTAPQVVVYDEKQNRVLYHGRINNLFEAVGNKRRNPSKHDLKDAIQEIKANQTISTQYEKPIGCMINFKE